MNITEIRVKLVPNDAERLKAFCSITLDGDFVIRDLKVIDGSNGLFVAMPSRKLCDRCPQCGAKNHLRARNCNDCGAQLGDARAGRDDMGRAKLHADIAHPINATCRERLQQAVVEAYEEEIGKSQEPGYEPPAFDDDTDYETAPASSAHEEEHEEEHDEEHEPEPIAVDADEEADEGQDEFASLIAGLNESSKARREERPRGDQGSRRGGRSTRPPLGEQRSEREKPAARSGGSALDDFLSRLGSSSSSSSGSGSGGSSGGESAGGQGGSSRDSAEDKGQRKRRGGRRGQGRRRERQQDQDQPAEAPVVDRTPPPAPEPDPVPDPVRKPVREPEPVPAAPPQAMDTATEAEEDDFGAGIL